MIYVHVSLEPISAISLPTYRDQNHLYPKIFSFSQEVQLTKAMHACFTTCMTPRGLQVLCVPATLQSFFTDAVSKCRRMEGALATCRCTLGPSPTARARRHPCRTIAEAAHVIPQLQPGRHWIAHLHRSAFARMTRAHHSAAPSTTTRMHRSGPPGGECEGRVPPILNSAVAHEQASFADAERPSDCVCNVLPS